MLIGCTKPYTLSPWEPMADNSEAVVLTKDATSCQETVGKLTGLYGKQALEIICQTAKERWDKASQESLAITK